MEITIPKRVSLVQAVEFTKKKETWTLSWLILSELKSVNRNQQDNLNAISKLLSDIEIVDLDDPIVS